MKIYTIEKPTGQTYDIEGLDYTVDSSGVLTLYGPREVTDDYIGSRAVKILSIRDGMWISIREKQNATK